MRGHVAHTIPLLIGHGVLDLVVDIFANAVGDLEPPEPPEPPVCREPPQPPPECSPDDPQGC
jgi:hypothetical protein